MSHWEGGHRDVHLGRAPLGEHLVAGWLNIAGFVPGAALQNHWLTVPARRETVFGRQRQKAPNWPPSGPSSLQRLEADLFTPAKSRAFGERQEISCSAGLRGGGCSLDRTCLHPKFPAI